MSEKNQEFAEAREKVKELLEEVGLELNSKKRERLAFLWRRAAWIRKRIQSLAAEGKVHHYDEMEAVSNEWAVSHIIILEEEVKRLRDMLQECKENHPEVCQPQ